MFKKNAWGEDDAVAPQAADHVVLMDHHPRPVAAAAGAAASAG